MQATIYNVLGKILGVVSVNASMSAVEIQDGSLRPLLPDRQAAACAMQDSDETNFILLLSTLNVSGWMVLKTDGPVITFQIQAHHAMPGLFRSAWPVQDTDPRPIGAVL